MMNEVCFMARNLTKERGIRTIYFYTMTRRSPTIPLANARSSEMPAIPSYSRGMAMYWKKVEPLRIHLFYVK